MIHPTRPHAQYLHDFQTRRAALGIKVPHDATPLWCKFRQADLSAAGPILTRLYSLTRGRPAVPPVDLLRAWLVMLECQITSIPHWVSRLREQPYYALLCGFDPEDVPGVGTFYDFQDRLLQLSGPCLNRVMIPRRRSEQRKRTGELQDKNDTNPHAGILGRLGQPLWEHPAQPAPYGAWPTNVRAFPRYQQVWQELFYSVFVATSVERHLIDLTQLHVAGDGTHLGTWANAHGHKVCACVNRGKPPSEWCTCARRFHDPQASWGWDSYRECFVYGHGLYELTAYSLIHDCQLPLALTLLDNHRHDSVAYLALMQIAVHELGLPIQTASLDKAHDALALYRLGAEVWHLETVVPLNERTLGHFEFPQAAGFTSAGIPLCLAQQPMAHDGFDHKHQRHKWRCPLAARDQRNRRRVPRKGAPPGTSRQPATQPAIACPFVGQGCSASPYGRTLYTYPKTNYRLFPRLPRCSPVWQRHADRRSCAERSIKRKKLDFGLERTRVAGRERWFVRVMLAAMCQHLDAWAAHAA